MWVQHVTLIRQSAVVITNELGFVYNYLITCAMYRNQATRCCMQRERLYYSASVMMNLVYNGKLQTSLMCGYSLMKLYPIKFWHAQQAETQFALMASLHNITHICTFTFRKNIISLVFTKYPNRLPGCHWKCSLSIIILAS